MEKKETNLCILKKCFNSLQFNVPSLSFKAGNYKTKKILNTTKMQAYKKGKIMASMH